MSTRRESREGFDQFRLSGDISPTFSAGFAQRARSKTWPSISSMPILVVDDYSTMIRIIRNLLKQIGFENVDDASDGSAALAQDAGQEIRPRDLRLEHGADDRLRPAAQVRASPDCRTTPFIMVTAESKTENVIAAKKAGVTTTSSSRSTPRR